VIRILLENIRQWENILVAHLLKVKKYVDFRIRVYDDEKYKIKQLN
jgi:hypothetical protein